MRIVEAVGRVADSGDAKRDEDLPAVPRQEPPAKDHTTRKEKSKPRQVRQSAEHLADRAQPKKSVTHLADASMAAGREPWRARPSFGGSKSGGEVWAGLAWGAWGIKKTWKDEGGWEVESPRHTQPGLITNDLD
jgi:hypothetical protein